MKKAIYIFLVVLTVLACSTDSNGGSESNDIFQDGQGGSLAIFALQGNYLYAVDNQDLTVFNIATSDNPVQVNTVRIGFGIETLFGSNDYLFIGSQNGMFIYSIEDPEFPVYVSEAQHFTACDPVVANETTAFVTVWSSTGCGGTLNELQIYDITNIENPALLSTRQLQSPKGLGLFGDYLFVCDYEIKIFDVSDPTSTVLAHSIDRLAFDVIIRNNTLIAIGSEGIYQYQLDSTDIQNTELLSSLSF